MDEATSSLSIKQVLKIWVGNAWPPETWLCLDENISLWCKGMGMCYLFFMRVCSVPGFLSC